MRTLIIVSCLSLLCSAGAQKSITSPPGFLSTEGSNLISPPGHPTWGTRINQHQCNNFGAWPDQRIEIYDAHHKGKGVYVIRGFEMRLDNQNQPVSQARSWKNVLLSLGNADYSKVTSSSKFGAGSTNTPTMVFSGSVAWPQWSGKPNPTGATAPWGKEVNFPFTTPYISTNTSDLLQDWRFSGGALGSGPWTAKAAYILDGQWNETTSHGYNRAGNYGSRNGTVPPCADSNNPTQDLRDYNVITHYAADSFNAGRAGKVYWDRRIFRLPKKATTYAAVLGTGLLSPTVRVFAPCRNLAVDLSAANYHEVLFGTFGTGGSTRPNPVPAHTKYFPIMKNLRIYGQVLWNDSLTGQLKLSRPSASQILPPPLGKIRFIATGASTTEKAGMNQNTIPIIKYNL